jgi:hypothetical protein
MNPSVVHNIKDGSKIIYNDGRPGHQDIEANVLAVDAEGMTVLFEDRADTNHIRFLDRKWMDFIRVVERTDK